MASTDEGLTHSVLRPSATITTQVQTGLNEYLRRATNYEVHMKYPREILAFANRLCVYASYQVQ